MTSEPSGPAPKGDGPPPAGGAAGGDWTDVDHAALARRLGARRVEGEAEALARLAELVGVVFRLRDDDGCPWDREQTLASMSKNLVEEACETAEAIAEDDDAHVAEELGDVLMNVALMSRIAEQEGRFDLAAVASGIAEKLVRRHRHVFGDKSADDADAALASWNASKAREAPRRASRLDGVPTGLPALLAALRTGDKAAATGFDWDHVSGALEKLVEEVDELRAAAGDRAAAEEELGDVLFAAVNVARKLDLDPELALRSTIVKFRRRFAFLEEVLGDRLDGASLDEMERLWRRAADAEDTSG